MPRRQSNDAAPQQQTPQRPNRRRRLLFIIVCLLSPVFLFAMIEGLLRWFAFGGNPPVLRPVGPIGTGTLYVTETKAASAFFFANRSRPGSMYEYDFLIPKPAGSFRVLVCGESAAKGFPQPRALAWSSFLEEMLRDLMPGRNVEVINTSTTAVASFPVLAMLQDSLLCQPDVVVIYCGNNEFYGAYGVASLHSAGHTPLGMRVQRVFRSTAVADFLSRLAQADAHADNRTLMESVIAKANIGPDDPLRRDAAANLAANISDMLAACRVSAVPIIVCTPPANERDMAPLGGSNPPGKADEHFLRAKSLFAAGKFDAARNEFQAAVDLDPMPWRPPGSNVIAIRDAALKGGAVVCDLAAAFRSSSPGGSIGWELMDDHVHPSLIGQDLVARTVLSAMADLSNPPGFHRGAVEKLPPWEVYAQRLGDNAYERYGVAHTMRVLCTVPFIRATNPGAFERYDKQCKDFEATLTTPLLEAARRWQDPKTHTGNIQRPLSAMAGRVALAQEQNVEASNLYATAVRCVPPYSSLNLEYTYFKLAARERVHGQLDDADRREALEAIERGRFLLAHGFTGTGMTERYMGRLHQLRGEFAEAVPLLVTARERLTGMDQVAADQALIVSYLKTGRHEMAKAHVEQQIDRGGGYTHLYQQMLKGLSMPTTAATARPSLP